MVKIIKNYVLFVFSIFLLGFGIHLVTMGGLGTTAISSLPYVLSLIFPLSFGVFTALFNMLYVVIQIVLLKREFPREQYLQIFVGPLLGASIDVSMYIFNFAVPAAYIAQLGLVIAGSAVIALSIVLQLKANVVNNSAEGIIMAISMKTRKEFGDVKFAFDFGLVLISIIVVLIVLGEVDGIREGTVLTVFIVGPLVKIFRTAFDKLISSVKESVTLYEDEEKTG